MNIEWRSDLVEADFDERRKGRREMEGTWVV
jgi:hypothetical protein